MRIALISGAIALVLSASAASAQGKAQPVGLSKAVVKSMTANKPKSKTALGAKAGIGRKSTVVTTKPDQAGPTSVREIGPARDKQ